MLTGNRNEGRLVITLLFFLYKMYRHLVVKLKEETKMTIPILDAKKVIRLSLSIAALFLVSLFFANMVSAHGYVSKPESRALLCADGVNYDCGAVVYEPQSLEGPGNFPEAGVPDGQIASAGGVFPKLDEQSADRWAKVPISSGPYAFEWTLTAAHATANWDYYITKEGWDPNDPLERSDFELFCSIDDNGKRPDFTVTHNCDIPDRSGYHVIFAYWEVYDTANAFYQVIDVTFDGEGEVPGPDPGDGEDNGDNEAPAWDANAVYLSGDKVSYNGLIYEAKWWSQNDVPGETSVWELVGEGEEEPPTETDPPEETDPPVDSDYPAWSTDTIYLGGDRVTHDGQTYEALWWTLGENPTNSNVWIQI